MKFKSLFKKKPAASGIITPEIIKRAYKRRFKEIESLRKHDLGEKTIIPIDLEALVGDLYTRDPK